MRKGESCAARVEEREVRRWCRWPCIDSGYGPGESNVGEVGDLGEGGKDDSESIGEVGVGEAGEEDVGLAKGSSIPFPAPSHTFGGK